MNKTVVELDLVGYSTICANFEQGLDVNSVAQLNQQIQSFVDAGLLAVNAVRHDHVMQTTGDGAIVVFDSSSEAHKFAQAVNDATRAHNRQRQQHLAKRVFRMGAASGDIIMEEKPGGGYDIAGMTIARAVRLEAKAQPGGILVDELTFEALSEEQKQRYASKEIVEGKRDEEFEAYACLLNPDGSKHAAYFISQKETLTSPASSVPVEPRTGSISADISRIIKYAPSELIGREDELKILSEAWDKAVRVETKRPHVLTFVALGGEGKTSLVSKWAADLAHQDWPGCDAVFAWSFYSQGTREQQAASSDLFLKEALTFFGDDADKEFAASNAGAYEKGQRLGRIMGRRRSLLILDGLEPLQYPASATAFKPGELKDQGIAKLLKDLASSSHGLCIVTTRIELPDLQAFKGGAVSEVHLKRLSRDAGVHLLKSLGVRGSELRHLSLKDGDDRSEKVNEFEKLVEDVKGHALTLTLLGGFLKRAFHGDIRQRDRVKFEKADEKIDGGHAFRTMAAYQQWLLRDGGDEGRREVAVLQLMGLFDRPADAGCLAALRSETIPGLTEPLAGLADDDWEFCLSGLEAAKLLTVNRDASGALVSLDAHPHLREYFAQQLRTQQPDAWRAAHRRLYEQLCANTKEGDQPTLEDLQPLYQAVAHGCQAGLQQESLYKVYYDRITRKEEKYAMRKLGAFGSELGAVACFFEMPWSHVSQSLTDDEQAWLLNQAAFRLRALGRLTESLEPMRAAVENYLQQENWKHAAIAAGNLSELELTLGEVAGAVGDAEQSAIYADRSGDAFQRMSKRTTHADALHQTGRRTEAETRFREAEQMQKETQPDYALLYSVQGFQYGDLLLAAPERAAWQRTLEWADLSSLSAGRSEERGNQSPHSMTLSASSQRVAQTLKWAEMGGQGSLLTIALDHLTLGRAALYSAILGNSDFSLLTSDLSHLDTAVAGLRRAASQDYIPRGLLTRAWLRFLTGAGTGADSAQEDLEEAWEIAERGPMRLHMADIHLYRARLFHAVKPYPWDKNPDGTERGPKDDLAAARKLIEKCGYWRRKEELEDAEEAAKNW
jgi:class 3 adenylate cyclase